jgi:hypothetical protein
MQSITTGLSMEIFFNTFQCFLLGYLIARNAVMIKKIKTIELENEYFKRKFTTTCDALLSESDQIHRSLLSTRESLEAAKPMKSNNWDSVREAFKGPVRIEISERN